MISISKSFERNKHNLFVDQRGMDSVCLVCGGSVLDSPEGKQFHWNYHEREAYIEEQLTTLIKNNNILTKR